MALAIKRNVSVIYVYVDGQNVYDDSHTVHAELHFWGRTLLILWRTHLPRGESVTIGHSKLSLFVGEGNHAYAGVNIHFVALSG